MFRRHHLLLTLALFASCRDLSLPGPPPPPRPGTLQGRVVFSEAGRTMLKPAVGATVQLVNTSISTTITNESGLFVLSPIERSSGDVLIRLDADGDGLVDHQKLISLGDVQAGMDRDVSLGEVLLGGNASIRGQVALADRGAATSGLSGTTVFVPEGPYITYTGDDGSFILENLPEGRLNLAFFRAGYAASSAAVSVVANELFSLNRVVLEPAGTQVTSSRVFGQVTLTDATDFSGVTVSLAGSQETATTNAAGEYAFPALTPGLHSFGFFKEGYRTAALLNVLVQDAQTELSTVSLASGPSVQPVLDAGLPPPIDAGVDAGTSTGTDAGLDAGVNGGFDAGVDAGFDGGVDAGFDGGLDAGFDAGVDAGFDAGVDAGLDAGTTVMTDAGADAGTDAGFFDPGPPIAFVDALADFYPPDTQVVLNGANSTGLGPLEYRWSQDAGPAVTLSRNNTILAATPGLTTPATPNRLKLGLTVVDAIGRVSAPRDFTLIVATQRPNANINPLPPNTMFANQTVLVGATGSSDPDGSGIVAWEWSVLPAGSGVVVTPQGNGSQAQLTAPASVPSNLSLQIQLVVTNGLGLRSLPFSKPFAVSAGSAPSWSLSASPLQVAAGGVNVTLNATASVTGVPANFAYQWSPSSSLDAGVANQNWTLFPATGPSVSFVTPMVQGPSKVLNFTVTATDQTGALSPLQRSANTTVLVEDRRPPQLAASSISSGAPGPRGSPFGAWVEYDEDLALPVLEAPRLLPLSTPLPPAPRGPPQLFKRRRFRWVYDGWVGENVPLRIETGGPRDLSTVADGGFASPDASVDFLVSFAWPAPAVASDSATATHPGVALLPNELGDVTAYLVNRNGTRVAFQRPLPLECDGGCVVTEDLTAPFLSVDSGTPRRGPRAVVASGVPYVMVQNAGPDVPSSVIVGMRDGGWAPLELLWGTIFTDGTKLYAVRVQNQFLELFTYNALTHLWESPEMAAVGPSWDPGPGNAAQAWGWVAASTGTRYVAAVDVSGNLSTFQRTPPGNWSSSTLSITAGSNPFVDVRLLASTVPGEDNKVYAFILRQQGQLEVERMGGHTGPAAFLLGVSDFDAVVDLNRFWVALIESGQLHVRFFNGTSLASLTGPRGDNSMNFDPSPSCVASSPAIAKSGEYLVVAWQEQCGTGPFKTYLRWIR